MKLALAFNSACLLALSSGMASPAMAQGAPSTASAGSASTTPRVAEVVVTAEKRSENIQDVPVTVTAISPQVAEMFAVTSTQNLQTAVTGLNYQITNGIAEPHIRGVGLNSVNPGEENSVATYIDGVYIASFLASLASLNNIQDIEIDKGPQGTLFGRNATAGVIAITTKNPSDQFHFIATAGYASYNTWTTSDYITGGVAPNLAADLAIYYQDQLTGYGKNLSTGKDIGKQGSFAVRNKWFWTPDPHDDVTLAMDFEQNWGSYNVSFRPAPGTSTNLSGTNRALPFGGPFVAPPGRYDIDVPLDPFTREIQGGVSLTVHHDFGFADFKSISAYRQELTHTLFSIDPGPTPVEFGEYHRPEQQFSQEVQLSSESSSVIKWIIGAYYFWDRSAQQPFDVYGPAANLAFCGNVAVNCYIDVRTGETASSKAGYAQATAPLRVLGNTNLTIGLRYTSEDRGAFGSIPLLLGVPPTGTFLASLANFSAPGVPNHETFDRMTYRISLDHRFTDDFMIFASYNEGFKSGGFNISNAGTPPVKPEILYATEAGFKSDLFDRRVRFNASAFYYDYKDIQVSEFQQFNIIETNGAGATLYGVDVDTQAAVNNNLTLRGGFEWLSDRFNSFPNAPGYTPVPIALGGGFTAINNPATGLPGFNASGKQIPFAPTLTANAAATYKIPTPKGPLDFTISYYHNSGSYTSANNISVLRVPEYDLVNLIAGWTSPDNKYRISVFVDNLTDEGYINSFPPTSANPGGWAEVIYGPPRTVGVELRVQY
jgi:iron complex outermembrane receptor protein